MVFLGSENMENGGDLLVGVRGMKMRSLAN